MGMLAWGFSLPTGRPFPSSKFAQLPVAIPEQVDSVIGLEVIALNWA
jgi:hypothetical protein